MQSIPFEEMQADSITADAQLKFYTQPLPLVMHPLTKSSQSWLVVNVYKALEHILVTHDEPFQKQSSLLILLTQAAYIV